MKLIEELLNINDIHNFYLEYTLLEDLGNLKMIDKSLSKILKTSPYYSKKPELRQSLGRNSKIESFFDKDQNKAFNRLKDDKNAIGLVLKYNDEQVLAVVHRERSNFENVRYNEKETYTLVTNEKFFEIVSPEKFNDHFSKEKVSRNYSGTTRTYKEKDWNFNANQVISGTDSGVIGKIKKTMAFLYDTAKENNAKVETMVIMKDEDRTEKTYSRSNARKGMIPLPTGNKIAIGPNKYSSYEQLAQTHFKNLGYELKSKLETYKASKAKAFDSNDDLLKSLIDEGYFDKLKFMGFTYNRYNEYIRFDRLMDKSKGKSLRDYDESYITYKIESKSTEYKKLEDTVAQIRSEIESEKSKVDSKEEKEEISQSYYEKRNKILPPEEFKVILKLDGGKIVPERIDIGAGKAWIY